MEIEKYHRQIRSSDTAGNVIVSPSTSPSNVWGELEQMGNMFTQFGFAAQEKVLQAEYYDQKSSLNLEMAKRFEAYKNGLDPEDTDNYVPGLENEQQSYEEIKVTHPRLKSEKASIIEEAKFRQKKNITDFGMDVKARNFQRNFNANYVAYSEMASKSTPEEYNGHLLDGLDSLFGLQLIDPAGPVKFENLESVKGYDSPMFHSKELRMNVARNWLQGTGEDFAEEQKNKFMQFQLNVALGIEDGEDYIMGLDLPTEDLRKMVSEYNFIRNSAKRRVQEELDLQTRTIERDIFQLQSSGKPGDNAKALELYNSPEAQELLSVPVLRTLKNGFNNTKTYTLEEKATAHTEGIETMVAYRAGNMTQADAKTIINKLRSEGKVDDVDGQAWTEELLGFKKSPMATSGNATAMDLGIKSINQIKGIETKVIQDAGGEVASEIAKRNAFRNQQIIDLEAWEKAAPRTPTEINKHVEAILAPAKEQIVKEVIKKGLWSRFFGNVESAYTAGLSPYMKKPEGMPKIKNDAEWEALAPGTEFIDPNGKVRVK